MTTKGHAIDALLTAELGALATLKESEATASVAKAALQAVQQAKAVVAALEDAPQQPDAPDAPEEPQPPAEPVPISGRWEYTFDAKHAGEEHVLEGAIVELDCFMHFDVPAEQWPLIASMEFEIDGENPQPNTPEINPPFDLYQPFDRPFDVEAFTEGEHTVTATISRTDGGTERHYAHFTVKHPIVVEEPEQPEGPGEPQPVPPVVDMPPGIPKPGTIPLVAAPIDLRGWQPPAGKGASLERGRIYQGPAAFEGLVKTRIEVIGEGPNPVIEAPRAKEAGHCLTMTNCRDVYVGPIDTIGGKNNVELKDCRGCYIAPARHAGAWAHGVNCRRDMSGTLLDGGESHGHGSVGVNSSASTAVGHALHLNEGCMGVTVRNMDLFDCREDGVQLGQSCGTGNRIIGCHMRDNDEDGADIKAGEALWQDNILERNRMNAMNVHPEKRSVQTLKGNTMRAGGTGTLRGRSLPGSCLEVKKQGTVIDHGGSYQGIDGEAPAIKVQDGNPLVKMTDAKVTGGGNSGRPGAIYLAAGEGHEFERVDIQRAGSKVVVQGSADNVSFRDCPGLTREEIVAGSKNGVSVA